MVTGVDAALEKQSGVRQNGPEFLEDPELHSVCDRFNSPEEAELFAKRVHPEHQDRCEVRGAVLFLSNVEAPWVAHYRARAEGWCDHRDELVLARIAVAALEGAA